MLSRVKQFVRQAQQLRLNPLIFGQPLSVFSRPECVISKYCVYTVYAVYAAKSIFHPHNSRRPHQNNASPAAASGPV